MLENSPKKIVSKRIIAFKKIERILFPNKMHKILKL